MESRKDIHIKANYRFSVVQEEILWRMLKSVYGWIVSDYLQNFRVKEEFAFLIPWLFSKYKRVEENPYWKYIREYKGHNIVPLILREEFASLICWNTVTPTFSANYMALGSDNTTPTNADLTLGTETLRGTFTDRFNVENVAYLDKYFSSAEVWGNSYLEAWVFVDGTASADTWYLLSRIIIDETMSATETLTINASFTIS